MKRKRPAFWNSHWETLDGKPIRRITREEYRELWRLWMKHKDIREGRVK